MNRKINQPIPADGLGSDEFITIYLNHPVEGRIFYQVAEVRKSENERFMEAMIESTTILIPISNISAIVGKNLGVFEDCINQKPKKQTA